VAGGGVLLAMRIGTSAALAGNAEWNQPLVAGAQHFPLPSDLTVEILPYLRPNASSSTIDISFS